MTYEVTIPEIGESITEALILRWIRKPGEHVGRDEILVELETDKVTVDLPSPVAGVVTELVAAEGEMIPVGGVIARIEEGAVAGAGSAEIAAAETAATAQAVRSRSDPATAFGVQSPVEAPAPEADGGTSGRVSSTAAPASPTAPATARPRHIMPAARRLIAEHDLDPAAIPVTGTGGRLLKKDVVAYLAARRKTEAAPAEPRLAEQTPAPPTPAAPPPRAAPVPAASTAPPDDATPRVAHALPSETATPAGEPPQPSPGKTSPVQSSPDKDASADGRAEERIAMTPIRRRIAERLVASQQQAALLTTFNEIDMSAVKDFRTRYRDAFENRHGVRLGFLSFFVKAAVDALRRFPRLNAEISGADIIYRNYHDIGIAVSTDRGLMVPVLRNAERLSFAEIESRIADFAGRARTGRIRIDELQGGTFTITNGGVFGSLLSTPIINPPQSGVLGLHAIQDRPVVEGGEIVVRPMMYVALTYDHRIVDGREAVSFLVRIKQAIQDPARMLIEV